MASTSRSSTPKLALVPHAKDNDSDSDGDHTDEDMAEKPPVEISDTRKILDEISELRRENFNLNLRRHLYEEASFRSPEFVKMAKELNNANNIIKVLEQDVADKANLLRQATDAITRHEELYKKGVKETQQGIDEQNKYIDLLETKIHKLSSEKAENITNMKKMKILEEMIKEKNLELAKNNEQLSIKEKFINSCSEKIKNLIKDKELLQKKVSHDFDGELEYCKEENHDLHRILDMVAPEMKKQKKLIKNTMETLKTMQKRESVLFNTLNNYRRASNASNRNTKHYIAEIRKLGNTYKGLVLDSDSESDDESFASSKSSLASLCTNLENK